MLRTSTGTGFRCYNERSQTKHVRSGNLFVIAMMKNNHHGDVSTGVKQWNGVGRVVQYYVFPARVAAM